MLLPMPILVAQSTHPDKNPQATKKMLRRIRRSLPQSQSALPATVYLHYCRSFSQTRINEVKKIAKLAHKGHVEKLNMLPFRPMLLTQFGTLADSVDKYRNVKPAGNDLAVVGATALPSKLQAPYFLSPKLDGVRCISANLTALEAHRRNWNGGEARPPAMGGAMTGDAMPGDAGYPRPVATCYSRFGSQLPLFPLIEEELEVLRHLSGDRGLCLDGELYLHDDQASIIASTPASLSCPKSARSKKKKPALNLPKSVADSVKERGGSSEQNNHNFTHGSGYRKMKEILGKLQYNDQRLMDTLAQTPNNASATADLDGTDILPSHPRYCIFDVVSYVPPTNPTCPLMAHVLVATGITSLATLECAPHRTSYMSRARTMVFLFTLLQAYTILMRQTSLLSLDLDWSTSSSSIDTVSVVGDVSSKCQSVMTYPAPIIKKLLADHSFRPTIIGGGDASRPPQYAPLHFRGGNFLKLVPCTCITNLDDAPNTVLPRYLGRRFEGAVVRTALNVYSSASGTEASAGVAAVRSPTAVKLLPYFDKEYMVLSVNWKGRRTMKTREHLPLCSILCATDCGITFEVSVASLPREESALLQRSIFDGHKSQIAAVGSYVTLQFAALSPKKIPINPIVKGVRGKDKSSFV